MSTSYFMNRVQNVSLVALVLALGVGACRPHSTVPPTPDVARIDITPGTTVPTMPVPAPSIGSRIEDERNTITIFRGASPSTVFVTQNERVTDFWSGSSEEVARGSGSGFVWDKLGHIVTNAHVVDGASSLTVTFEDQKTVEARLVGKDPRKDIAVLKVDVPEDVLVPVNVPAKAELEVGQKTIAIGNPFGLDHTLTTGIVSALGRQVGGFGNVTIRDMIQTDAAINPGNSGGPLLDSQGQLIGMNTMIFSKSGSSAGIGFAVPASTISRIVPQLIKNGRVDQLGLGLVPVTQLESRIKGVVIGNVAEGGPAQAAGLKGMRRVRGGYTLGDVIVGIDDKKVDNFDDYYNVLDNHKAGDQVKLRVLRGQKIEEIMCKVVVLNNAN